MRLNEKEIEIIKKIVAEHLGDAQVYLFGSRVDKEKMGGDIDLFIVSDKNDYDTKIGIRSTLIRLLGKPVDIVMHRDFDRPIERQALKGIRL